MKRNILDIVLATSPSEDDKHGILSMPPLGLGSIATIAQQLPDTDVTIVDAYGEDLSVDQTLERVLALSPDINATARHIVMDFVNNFGSFWQLLTGSPRRNRKRVTSALSASVRTRNQRVLVTMYFYRSEPDS